MDQKTSRKTNATPRTTPKNPKDDPEDDPGEYTAPGAGGRERRRGETPRETHPRRRTAPLIAALLLAAAVGAGAVWAWTVGAGYWTGREAPPPVPGSAEEPAPGPASGPAAELLWAEETPTPGRTPTAAPPTGEPAPTAVPTRTPAGPPTPELTPLWAWLPERTPGPAGGTSPEPASTPEPTQARQPEPSPEPSPTAPPATGPAQEGRSRHTAAEITMVSLTGTGYTLNLRIREIPGGGGHEPVRLTIRHADGTTEERATHFLKLGNGFYAGAVTVDRERIASPSAAWARENIQILAALKPKAQAASVPTPEPVPPPTQAQAPTPTATSKPTPRLRPRAQPTPTPRHTPTPQPTRTPAPTRAPTPLTTPANRSAETGGRPAVMPPATPVAQRMRDLQNARWLEHHHPETARTIRALAWVRDGISTLEEEQALTHLLHIAVQDHRAAEDVTGMPFIQKLDPGDAQALWSLANIAHPDPGELGKVLAHPGLRGGITDRQTPLIGVLWGVAGKDPSLAGEILEPGGARVESRSIVTRLTGTVELRLVRLESNNGNGWSGTMDLLEAAVRGTEDFMQTPLPTRMVSVLFADTVTPGYAGNNFGTGVTVLPQREKGEKARELANTLAYEVAHYYWSGNRNWINEGMANLIEIYHARSGGTPLEASTYPCGRAESIRQLEQMNPGKHDPAFACNYSLGERLFLTMLANMGERDFRRGAQTLYRLSRERKDGAGIREVNAAFGDRAAAATARWYDGAGPRPGLAQAGGSGRDGGGSGHNAAARREDRHVVQRPEPRGLRTLPPRLHAPSLRRRDRRIQLTLAQEFEDGFTYRRDRVEFSVSGAHIGGIWSIGAGPGPGRTWAAGRHRATLWDHRGVKIAEAGWTVLP